MATCIRANNTFIFAYICAKYLWKVTEGIKNELSSDREAMSWEKGMNEKFPISVLSSQF